MTSSRPQSVPQLPIIPRLVNMPSPRTAQTPQAIPIVTASAWAIHDGNTGRLLFQKNGDEQREMASLTKMTTLLVSYNLAIQYEVDISEISFVVEKDAASIIGTHSGLRNGDSIKIIDLFYAMMLPSGNDAALTLAMGFGNLILSRKGKQSSCDKLACLAEFIKEMNKTSSALGLKTTKYSNPHGLGDKANKSTVGDLGKIAYNILKVPLLQTVVSTQKYTATIIKASGENKNLSWTNTNKMLEKGFGGMKTGVTPTAGPCLCSFLKREGESVIITILNSKTMDHRWIETEALANWALEGIALVKGGSGSDSYSRRVTTSVLEALYR